MERSWLDQITRSPGLDEAIASFVGSMAFLRRMGLADEEIRRLCQQDPGKSPR
ncbi:MAG: hypothetical protein P1V51_20705 [Deltaproteobacteria bacterium]|nr:hypothetical protein [Deltaproteobacteria bacterium]